MSEPFITIKETVYGYAQEVDTPWTREDLDDLWPKGESSVVRAVLDKYDALAAELAACREQLAYANDAAAKGDLARQTAGGMEMEIQELRARLEAAERDAADKKLDAGCYHLLCGLIRANPNAAADEVLDWFKGDAARGEPT